MKAVILAGGHGTRISEETAVRPKPMVEIGGRPILWHIMKIYSHYGINEFVICCGYKGHIIKQYFANFAVMNCDIFCNFETGDVTIQKNGLEPWKVAVVDTGDGTMTGGRLKRVAQHLEDDTFCFTYGDGVADVDIGKLVDFHKKQDFICTLTAVQSPGRFGVFSLEKDENRIRKFAEKPEVDGSWINGGFFVLEPAALDYIVGDDTVWEREPLERLAREGELSAYRHTGFWQPMDTLRDKTVLEESWQSGRAPWKVW